MKLVKIVSSKKYVDKKGVERNYTNFAIEKGNTRIFVKPCFPESFKFLDLMAEEVTIEDKKESKK